MDVTEIRRENLRAVANKLGGNARLAEKLGQSSSFIGQLIGKTPKANIGNTLARKIETQIDKPHGWLDQPHTLSALDPDAFIRAVKLAEDAMRAERLTLSPEKRARLYLEIYKRMQTASLDLGDARSLALLAA